MFKHIIFESQHTSWDSLIKSLEKRSKRSLDFQYALWKQLKKLGEYTLELEKKNEELNTHLKALIFSTQMKDALVRDLQKEIKDFKTQIK